MEPGCTIDSSANSVEDIEQSLKELDSETKKDLRDRIDKITEINFQENITKIISELEDETNQEKLKKILNFFIQENDILSEKKKI